jgi:CubicO group peptidase (beta-lactamase class C family)
MNSLVSRMEHIIQSSVIDQQFMGSVLVSLEGKILLDKGFGYANLEWQIPNSPTTKFRIGSITKQFTAAAILILEEKGKLKITDSLKTYMRDAPTAWDAITIYNLMTHTSGIPNYTKFPEFASMTTITKKPEEQIELFRNKPLDFQPGTNYAYNNSGYVLLGYLIEIISEKSYQDFIVKNIFEPLGMKDSGYDSHSSIILQRASGYEMSGNELRNTDYLDMSIPYSAGSLYSTVQDMLRWVEGLFSRKLLSLSSLEKMIIPYKNNYGCGVINQLIDDHESIMHAGGINGFNSLLIHSPDDKLSVISLSNMNAIGYPAQDIAMKMVKLVRGHHVTLPDERIITPVSENILAKYVGIYKLKSTNVAYTVTIKDYEITLENGSLMAQTSGQKKIKLFPESETKFFGKIPDVQIEFFVNQMGKITHLIQHQDGEESIAVLQ